MNRAASLWISGLLVLVVSVFQCHAKSKAPLFVDPGMNPAMIDRIDVYVIDPTHDENNDLECMGGARFGTAQLLAQKGYNLGGRRRPETKFYEAQITPSEEMLLNPAKQWLHDLGDQQRIVTGSFWTMKRMRDTTLEQGPPTGQWAMIITIDELGSRLNAVKGLGNAALSVYLYDRNQPTLLWHDHAEKPMWGGLLGNVMERGPVKQKTCSELVSSMMVKLPKHRKTKR